LADGIKSKGWTTTFFGPPQAGADVLGLLDVARWNAGRVLTRPHWSQVVEVNSNAEFETLLAANCIVLLAFTTRWCSRCMSLTTEFDAASHMLTHADSLVALGSIDVDDPSNRLMTQRFGVLSFPVGKIFFRGRFVADFMGGTTALEIVAEMLSLRAELLSAEHQAQGAIV